MIERRIEAMRLKARQDGKKPKYLVMGDESFYGLLYELRDRIAHIKERMDSGKGWDELKNYAGLTIVRVSRPALELGE